MNLTNKSAVDDDDEKCGGRNADDDFLYICLFSYVLHTPLEMYCAQLDGM